MSANVLTGSLTASGTDGAKSLSASKGVLGTKFNLTLSGTFVGTVALQRSFDGTTWFPLTRAGAAVTFTAPCSEVFDEPEDGVLYRVNCTAFTSGTINYRLSQ